MLKPLPKRTIVCCVVDLLLTSGKDLGTLHVIDVSYGLLAKGASLIMR